MIVLLSMEKLLPMNFQNLNKTFLTLQVLPLSVESEENREPVINVIFDIQMVIFYYSSAPHRGETEGTSKSK